MLWRSEGEVQCWNSNYFVDVYGFGWVGGAVSLSQLFTSCCSILTQGEVRQWRLKQQIRSVSSVPGITAQPSLTRTHTRTHKRTHAHTRTLSGTRLANCCHLMTNLNITMLCPIATLHAANYNMSNCTVCVVNVQKTINALSQLKQYVPCQTYICNTNTD